MATTLCVDLGNTRQKAAVFSGSVLEKIIFFKEDILKEIKAIVSDRRPQNSIIASVIEHDPAIDKFLAVSTSFHRLSPDSKLPFAITVNKPATVGADRLALSAAAVHFYPNKHNLVIGCGTCITYNFVSKDNRFLGGSISPGMEMRFRAMNEFTAKLPRVQPDWNVPLIGYDTVTNMQSGVVLGIAKEIDGMIEMYEERFGNFNVLLTGGDLGILVPHLKKKIFADPDLIFKGLYAISQVNNA